MAEFSIHCKGVDAKVGISHLKARCTLKNRRITLASLSVWHDVQ
uniref:Uncharacterized protein n=1 Tax=Anguilla anguilla TaxID=7936 RepID=A0A0E9WPY5_ANGAN